jgi:hypothetical protein
VNYQPAYDAFNAGDYFTAVPLLEKAAHETDFSSDVINHAYTLALYHTRDKRRLAATSLRIANSLLASDPASAMDYFQRAILAGIDAADLRRIGEVFERWGASAAAPLPQTPVRRVAQVLGWLSPDDERTEYVKILVRSLRAQGIDSTIFTTESSASWFCNPARVAQSRFSSVDAQVKVAEVEGDFEGRALKIAAAIRESDVQVAFFHSSLDEQITARVASLHPAPIQINVNHGSEMDADLFEGCIHFFKHAVERTRFKSKPAEWIPIASSVETRMAMVSPVTRQGIGLESAATVSATFGSLDKCSGAGYLRALTETLKRFPKHFHVFAGAGNVKAIRSHLHAEGVLSRVRFWGQVADVAPLLNVIDIYLASFPQCAVQPVLDAMCAGKPVVALQFGESSEHNSAAELVGIRELTANGEGEYVQIIDRAMRNPSWAKTQSELLLARFRGEFRSELLGERYCTFIASLT